jgi:hypothetical protein
MKFLLCSLAFLALLCVSVLAQSAGSTDLSTISNEQWEKLNESVFNLDGSLKITPTDPQSIEGYSFYSNYFQSLPGPMKSILNDNLVGIEVVREDGKIENYAISIRNGQLSDFFHRDPLRPDLRLVMQSRHVAGLSNPLLSKEEKGRFLAGEIASGGIDVKSTDFFKNISIGINKIILLFFNS